MPDRPLVLLHGLGTGPEAWRQHLGIVFGAGHVANLDAAEAFNEALREFLDSP